MFRIGSVYEFEDHLKIAHIMIWSSRSSLHLGFLRSVQWGELVRGRLLHPNNRCSSTWISAELDNEATARARSSGPPKKGRKRGVGLRH